MDTVPINEYDRDPGRISANSKKRLCFHLQWNQNAIMDAIAAQIINSGDDGNNLTFIWKSVNYERERVGWKFQKYFCSFDSTTFSVAPNKRRSTKTLIVTATNPWILRTIYVFDKLRRC